MTQSLRIIFLVESVHEQGTYFRWHNLAIGLQARGHRVIVYGVDWNRHSSDRIEYRDGVEYNILSTFRGLSIFTPSTNPLNLIRRLAIRYPACDIVHSFQPFPFSACIGWFLNQKGRAKAFFYDWDDLWTGGLYKRPLLRRTEKVSYPLVRYIEKHFPSRADVTTVCSGYLRDLAIATGSQRTTVIHNGFWPYEPIPKHQARIQLGLRPDALYMGYMGRTNGELAWCLNALQEVLTRTKDNKVRLALCGMQADSLTGLPPELITQIDYFGQLTPSECQIFAAALDFGLLPLSDNAFNQSRFPIKFADYQAAGTPIIYSEVGECHLIGKHFAWNSAAGNTQQQFIECFVETTLKALSGNLPKVDMSKLTSLLNWQLLADHLSIDYEHSIDQYKK